MLTLTKLIIATLLSLCLFACNNTKNTKFNLNKHNLNIHPEEPALNTYKIPEKVNK